VAVLLYSGLRVEDDSERQTTAQRWMDVPRFLLLEGF